MRIIDSRPPDRKSAEKIDGQQVGGALAMSGKPRICGKSRANAAYRKRLRSGKFLGAALRDGSSNLDFVLRFEGERQGKEIL